MTLPDKDSGSTYGALNKVDYQNLPPADPTTDWSNPQIAPAFCNVAGITQVLQRVNFTVILNPTSSSIVVTDWNAVWGNITTTPPTCQHVSTGKYSFIWPTVVSDEYNASFGVLNNHSVNFTKGWANLQNPGGLASAHVESSGNILVVTLYDHTNSLNDFTGVVMDVYGAY